MPMSHPVYEVTITCATEGCGHFVTERATQCSIDTERLRKGMEERSWICYGPPVPASYGGGTVRKCVDMCPSCVGRAIGVVMSGGKRADWLPKAMVDEEKRRQKRGY